KRLAQPSLRKTDGGSGSRDGTVSLHVVRASDLLEARKELLRRQEVAPSQMDLQWPTQHAEEVRVDTQSLDRQLAGPRERLVPAAEHGENVGLLAQGEPLTATVAAPPREGERPLQVVEAVAVPVTLHREVGEVA